MMDLRLLCALLVGFASPSTAPPQPIDPNLLRGAIAPANGLWIEQFDIGSMTAGWGRASAGRSVQDNPLVLKGVRYRRGVGTHAQSEWTLELQGEALRFAAMVGLHDEIACGESAAASVRYLVKADGKVVADSGVIRWGDDPRLVDADLTDAQRLTLIVDGGESIHFDHAAWAGALLVVKPEAPRLRRAARPLPPDRPAPPPLGAVPASRAAAEVAALKAPQLPRDVLGLDELLAAAQLAGLAAPAPSDARRAVAVGGSQWPRGVAGLADRDLEIDLAGQAERFAAIVGLSDDARCAGGDVEGSAVRLQVLVDGVKRVDTGPVAYGDEPLFVGVDLRRARNLKLVIVGGMAPDSEAGALAGATIAMAAGATAKPVLRKGQPEPPIPIATGTDSRPAIHHPRVVGTTPGRPFLFRIPATGEGPLLFSADELPAGVTLDARSGILSGSVASAGTYTAAVEVAGAAGRAVAKLTIDAGLGKLALTPPLGWNSWNVWGLAVDDAKVRAAADAMISSGLASRGFSYINIDDGWEKDRDASGEILPNEKFPDMRSLADYVHSKGLKLGIYSSPGPKTCGGYTGSFQHEARDARTYARWGIDYLKYDWCSYGEVVKGASSLETLQKPYKAMRAALDATDRDIVFSLCQYGMGDVWTWGASVGGNLWRTTGDITDTWSSLSKIGFAQAALHPHARPGHWNDPDMLVVGQVGWGPRVRPSRLTPNEQITHITLWAVLAAPMLIGADMSRLDRFTLDVLTNEEVLAVNQDPLGRQGRRVSALDSGAEVWARELADGTFGVALFNRGAAAQRVEASFGSLGLSEGQHAVRDLWAKKDLGRFAGSWGAIVPRHGAMLLKVGVPRP
jgi:alpha-galactosidase